VLFLPLKKKTFRIVDVCQTFFNPNTILFADSPPQPAGCFRLFQKHITTHFLNLARGGTESKEAAYAVTVFNSKKGSKRFTFL
jgi:hypothetical protein